MNACLVGVNVRFMHEGMGECAFCGEGVLCYVVVVVGMGDCAQVQR
jgi:hypothetical protein